MDFYTGNTDKRPIRLSEATRQFAWESMHFRYGQEAMRNPAVSLDEVPGWEEMSRLERYDADRQRRFPGILLDWHTQAEGGGLRVP